MSRRDTNKGELDDDDDAEELDDDEVDDDEEVADSERGLPDSTDKEDDEALSEK